MPNYASSSNLKWKWHCRDADGSPVSDVCKTYVRQDINLTKSSVGANQTIGSL